MLRWAFRIKNGVVRTKPVQIALFFIAVSFLFVPILVQSQQQRPKRELWPEIGNNHVTTNRVLVKIAVGEEIPARIAYWIPGENRQYDNQLTAENELVPIFKPLSAENKL